jgi:leucine dehydrogenase
MSTGSVTSVPKAASTPARDAFRAASVPPVPLDHEELVVRRGPRSGLWMAVAVHSTALGPALGGVRLWRYATPEDGVRDALRLARGMTFKAAAAGLDLGGGKGVIRMPPDAAWQNGGRGIDRRDVLHDFGDLVESLDGRYITAEDVGVGAEDIAVIATRTEHAVGLPEALGGAGDPSPFTALGVSAAMRACARSAFGSRELGGLRVVIVGAGHCGEQLARRLARAGAELALSDIDARKRGLAVELDAEWIEPSEAMLTHCDVLAPCALGGAIDRKNVDRLDCSVVCGSANNMLADESLDRELAARGIVYAPDFLANAGGLISVYRELHGLDSAEVTHLVEGIEETVGRVLAHAADRGVTPLAAAHELAHERLDAAGAPLAA